MSNEYQTTRIEQRVTMTNLSKIYVYAIIDSNTITGKPPITGFNNNPIYTVSFNDISAVVSDFPEGLKDVTTIALHHEKTVEELMEFNTILPMRLQTLFKNKEDILVTIEKNYDDFKNNLTRLTGKIEFGLKALWQVDKIKKDISDNYYEDKNKTLTKNTPSRDYLNKKYKEYKINEILNDKADKCISMIDGYFSEIAVEKKLQKLQTDKLILNAAYLIDKSQKDRIIQIFKQLRENFNDLKFLFSGPWPPYNFIKKKTED